LVQQTFDDVLLSIPTPNLIHKFASLMKRLPAKGGRTLRMARYDRLPTAPVPLGPSGATPPATPLVRMDIDATMSFYGLYVAVNQQVKNNIVACLKSVLIDLDPEVAFS
jgi:hypothetical protein